MNQRREPRFPVDRPVEVTIFGPPDIQVEAKVRNASGRGMGLEIAGPLPPGTALKITLEDSILLGEVIYCRAEEKGWYAGVELAHALFGLAELAKALQPFAEEFGQERPRAMQHAGREGEK